MSLQSYPNVAGRFPETTKLVDGLPLQFQGPQAGNMLKTSLIEITTALHETAELLLAIQKRPQQPMKT
jgi:hypothetical protein